jgi:NAD(P)-dependent dehydrogenase (short-subunit alcohol dehydrogenase family)
LSGSHGPQGVLVTGAASGIGPETSLQLARLGRHVIVADKDIAGGEEGARSLVFAAVDASVRGGGDYGPTGIGQIGGRPGRVDPSPRALDEGVAAQLWEASERLTGVRYEMIRA